MNIYYDSLDNRECTIIFEEHGRASIRFARGEVRHGVPLSRLRTQAQYAAWLLVHPKGQEYLHEVLEVVAEARRHPRQIDETDNEWMAYLRANCAIHADLRAEEVEKFCEQYNAATGETLVPDQRPGVLVRRWGANKRANTLYITFAGTIPDGCPADVFLEHGHFVIRNTRFIWSLIAREGFRLDP